jgi:DNA-binding XRE family transcriptional regulator
VAADYSPEGLSRGCPITPGADGQRLLSPWVTGDHQQRPERPTQEELAFEAEIDLTYVGGIERGKRNPSLMVMARIADALSVPLVKLLNSSTDH